MRNVMKVAPDVANAFFGMAKEIKEYSPLDDKVNELILIGIFTAHRGLRGIGTHVERAMATGATKEEIIAAILLAMPIVGCANVTLSLEKALSLIEGRPVEVSYEVAD